jgi:SagB-type dehydrogenase family enzyme
LYSSNIFDELIFNDKNISKFGMVICLVGFINKLYWKYKKNAIRQCILDCRFVSENFYLLANALNLNIYAMGGFQENALSEMFDFKKWQIPLLLMPLGNK